MPWSVPQTAPSSLQQINLTPRVASVHPSPADWRDQLLYFLLPDRFCDNAEPTRPKYAFSNPGSVTKAPKAAWMDAGTRFQGGTLKGLQSKIPYLKNRGITALWVGPVFKQRKDLETYHGYGIQHFLDVDPRFGSRQDLCDLVDAAHQQGMYVLLDIIYNHTGNNWFYDLNGQPRTRLDYRYAPPYPIHGWRSGTGQSVPTIATVEDGVWPSEFQEQDWYTRAGKINRWDPEQWENPLDPRNEFRRGDFFDLKDLKLNEYESPSGSVLDALLKVYQYWIALTDCDGFRVDTVKHVPFETSRNFCGGVHEYAEAIGKENFLILGEVTGGAFMSRSYLDIFGRNIDAAIDLGGPMDILSNFVKGLSDPMAYFRQYGGQDELGSHRVLGSYHVAMHDDHDCVSRDPKHRFAAGNSIPNLHHQAANVVGTMLTSLGIPCIYYGSEQCFDGAESYHDTGIEPLDSDNKVPSRDRYVRESMFGGTFGAFQTSGCSFFNDNHPTYIRIAAIARIARRPDRVGQALRRGRQYPREVRFLGSFLPPTAGELVAWSRILVDREVLVALNTNGTQPRGGDVTIDSSFHSAGDELLVLYRDTWSDAQLTGTPPVEKVQVQSQSGRTFVRLDLDPAGMMILTKA
ncbi:MAG: alpha-amlyase [Acidobacteria bacterium]|nr:MAG: alpha-amlyase [Acidobacteriota bacterium]